MAVLKQKCWNFNKDSFFVVVVVVFAVFVKPHVSLNHSE